MGFHDVVFPERLSAGSRLGPGYRTVVLETDNRRQYRNSRWARARHQYDVSHLIQEPDEVAELLTFYHARMGGAYGFKFHDAFDYSTASDHRAAPAGSDYLIGVGDATHDDFQLEKVYDDTGEGLYQTRRAITKPKQGTVVVELDGVPQTEGVHFTVDHSTGIVHFLSTPALGEEITAGCEFYVPVAFGAEADEWFSGSGDTGSADFDSIPIVELPDQVELPDMSWPGGARFTVITEHMQLGFSDARLQVFRNISGGSLDVTLPDPEQIPEGAEERFVVQLSADSTASLVVKDPSGTVDTLSPAFGLRLYVGSSWDGSAQWYAGRIFV